MSWCSLGKLDEENMIIGTYRYAVVRIGMPPQAVEMDLNMLISDFYVVTTTSRTGSRYDDFFSQSNGA